ncbi:MAG TPA: MBL fold metallo-hydrolase [Burkholderiaceae bacterium]|nr:MBL fold metallo-hydrolase [Burkholderiaceae bacterium]
MPTSGSTVALRVGAAELARVEDYLGPGFEPAEMFPAFREEMWRAERDWLVPTFYDPVANRLRTSMHSWIVRTGRHVVLIDACIGNGKCRPSIPRFHMRESPWLERLHACGVAPEQVDYVMCTHLHADHVGWNTRQVDGRWVPTFPNARYLFGRGEYRRWDSRRPDHQSRPINENVFEDSILPIADAGLMVLVDDGHTVDDMLTVEAAPGHTPGHAQIRLRSQGSEAVFCGDVIHHPVQIPYPVLRSVFDEDSDLAAATRERLLRQCAERDVLLLPSHFAEPHYCKIDAAGDRFMLRWV